MNSKLFYLLFYTFFLFSCSDQQDSSHISEDEQAHLDFKDNNKEKRKDANLAMVINDIPSTMEITTILFESNSKFNKRLLNDLSNINNYNTIIDKSINLGIIATDLNYVIAYHEPNEVLKYLKALKDMAEIINITGIIDQELIQKVMRNVENKDSLFLLMFPVHLAIDKYLHDNEQANTAALILAGGWIEGIYLSTQVLDNELKNKTNFLIYEKISEQKNAVQNIIKLLSQYENNPDKIISLIHELKEISAILHRTNQDAVINHENMILITEKIKKIRTNCI